MDLKKLLEKYFKDQVSDEAITEISTLFEAAVNERVKDAVVAKETELEESNKAEMAKFKTELVDKLSEYSKVAVDEFIDDNRPAIESDIKVNVSEAVMTGLVAVLKDQYIVVPEGETNVVADLESKVTKVEEKLNDAINTNIEGRKQILEYEKAMTFKRLITEADLTDVDSEKVLDLLEGIDADDVDVFEEKTKIIISKVIEDSNGNNDDVPNKKKEDLNEKLNGETGDELEESEIDKYVPFS